MLKFRVPIRNSMLTLAIVAILAATLLLSFFSLNYMEQTLAPEMHKKAATIGESLQGIVTKVVGYGERFSKLNGMDAYLEEIHQQYPDIAYIVITNRENRTLYQNGLAPDISRMKYTGINESGVSTLLIDDYYNTSLLLKDSNGLILGYVHLGQEKGLIQKRLEDSLLDIVTVIVVSILISFELLLFLMMFTISTPVAQMKKLLTNVSNGDFSHVVEITSRDEIGKLTGSINRAMLKLNDAYYRLSERINTLKFSLGEKKVSEAIGKYIDTATRINLFTPPECAQTITTELTQYIRPALFLLIFAESLSLSFFPIYVNGFYEPMEGLSREMVIGLPISVFMLIWALSLPSAGGWSDRVGRRKSFLIGALITTVGLVLTGFSQTMYDLLLWRSLTAVGYGIVFITCQGYITDHTTSKNRTQGMAMFLAGFFSGSLCGAATGGILADHVGYQMTFILSGALSLAAAIFVLRFIHDHRQQRAANLRKVTFSDYLKVLSNVRFMVLTLFAAIPAKIALTGFLYYTGPLYMSSLGTNQSSIGRVMMAYGIAMVALSPLIGRLADRIQCRAMLVTVGGLLSTGALMVLYFQHNLVAVLISITLLGVAHAIGVSPQITLMTEISKRHADEIGLGTTIGIFRLVERLGNVAGPVISGLLITVYGFPGAFVGIAIVTFGGIVLFATAFAIFQYRDNHEATILEQHIESVS